MKENSKDLYEILGVKKNSSEKEIKKAYRKKAKEVHPDVKADSNNEFIDLAKAYKILSDPIRKDNYDRLGYDDPEMLNQDKLAISIIENLFSQFLSQNESLFDTEDIFRFISNMIKKKTAQLHNEKIKFENKIKFLKKVKSRIKFKKNNTEKNNFIFSIIDSQISSLKIEIKKSKFYIEINDKSLIILKDYSYDIEIFNNSSTGFLNLNRIFSGSTSTATTGNF